MKVRGSWSRKYIRITIPRKREISGIGAGYGDAGLREANEDIE
jgi:hypothetical protein